MAQLISQYLIDGVYIAYREDYCLCAKGQGKNNLYLKSVLISRNATLRSFLWVVLMLIFSTMIAYGV